MNLFNKVTDIFGLKNQLTEDNYENMTKEQLVKTTSHLNNENKSIKSELTKIINENNLLNNSVINNSDNNSSQFGKFFLDIKNSFFKDEYNDYYKDLNSFKTFLYDNNLFYGGLEENDINLLKKKKINIDENWKDNKNAFLFKQKLLDRNYKELFKNLFISKEFNNLINSRNNVNYSFNEDKNIKSNNNIVNEEPKNRENEINENKKIFSENNQNIKLNREKEKDNEFVTKMKKTLPKKSKNTEKNLFDNLLDDDDEEGTKMNEKKNKWDEDDE